MLVWAGVIVIARVHFITQPNTAEAHCDDVIVFPLTRLDINLRGLARSTCSENNPVFAQSGLNVDTENKV